MNELDSIDFRRPRDIAAGRTAQEHAPMYDTELARGCPKGWIDKFYRATAVYRYFGDGGALLYVGQTNDVDYRNAQHLLRSPWYRLARIVRVEWFPCRDSATWAEAVLISSEKPEHNLRIPPSGSEPPYFARWFFPDKKPVGRKPQWFRLTWGETKHEWIKDLPLAPCDAPNWWNAEN